MTYPFTLPPLPYSPDALAPVIDAATMTLHHDKHHQAYVDKLNAALKDHGDLHSLSLTELLAKGEQLPEGIRAAVRNQGGGHANHTMFWQVMGSPNTAATPTGELATMIDGSFGSFEDFKKKFNEAGEKQFGSGWVFAVINDGKIAIVAQPNQDTPLLKGQSPLFGNDVWEHAYYLNYNNRRGEYLQNWWKVLDWAKVDARYQKIKAGQVII